MQLSPIEVATYQQDGILFLPSLFDETEIAALKAEQARIFTLDLAAHHGTAGTGGKLQLDQGIIEAESIAAAGSGQAQQLALKGRRAKTTESLRGLLQQGAVGFLHHGGNQEQIHHLADTDDAEAHQPDTPAHGLAAIEAVDAVEPKQPHRPEQIGEPQAALLLPQHSQGR